MQRYEKITIFLPIFRFISEMIQLLRDANRRSSRSIKWCYFQWSWVTFNPDFDVTPLFDAEYLKKCTRYRDGYNKGVISNNLEWP